MGITIRGNGLKANTGGRMGNAKFLNKVPDNSGRFCRHGVEIVLCGPCWNAQRKESSCKA